MWACSYDSGTGKFTISSDIAFVLLCGSGANLATSVFKSLGFIQSGSTGSDTGSATSQTASFTSYQSTHFVGIDLLNTTYSLLDLTARGRDEDPAATQSWVRHHDRYEAPGHVNEKRRWVAVPATNACCH